MRQIEKLGAVITVACLTVATAFAGDDPTDGSISAVVGGTAIQFTELLADDNYVMGTGFGLLGTNPETGARHWAFCSVTPEQREIQEEFLRRGEAGVSRMELFTPELWAPLPGLLTGLIVGDADDPVYLTGIGDAIVKLDR